MGDLSRNDATSIMHLPDDCLTDIFHALDSHVDRESFGLTCRRWLHLQNFNRRSLQFESSFTILKPSSLSGRPFDIKTFHLHRLLMRFQHLESLSLCGCTEMNDSGLTRLLSYGSNLRKLNLDCCLKLTDYGLSLVASGCPSLMAISLYRCLSVTDVGLKTLATACLSLKHVNLSYCSQISDNGLQDLTRRCRQLQTVNVSHCEGISGDGFRGCSKTLAYVEAESCQLSSKGAMAIVSGGGIEYLDLSFLSWSYLRDSLPAFGFSSSSLKILNFRMCRSASNTTIENIAKGCPLLEEWNLALCHEVTTSGWRTVGLYCQNLKRLHVNRCLSLSDNGLQALRDGCKSLSILYLNGCVRVTSVAIELFKFQRSNVCIKEEEVMCIKPYSPF